MTQNSEQPDGAAIPEAPQSQPKEPESLIAGGLLLAVFAVISILAAMQVLQNGNDPIKNVPLNTRRAGVASRGHPA